MADRAYTLSTPYSEVTDRIVQALEKGVAPWVCPWDRSGGKPKNGASGHVYRGINAVMTGTACYSDPRWFTFRQATNLGGSVKKGERGTPVVFYQFSDKRRPVAPTDSDAEAAEAAETTDSTRPQSTRPIPFARVYYVWNHSQITWATTSPMAAPAVTEPVAVEAWEQAAQEFVAAIGAAIEHGGTRACYIPALDKIQMPDIERFGDRGSYWSTCIHEIGHWSGHPSRLNRDLTGRFGSAAYGAEELVAELTSAFVSADLKVPGQLQHAEYVNSWISMMKADSKAIFSAARLAQQAADYLHERYVHRRVTPEHLVHQMAEPAMERAAS